MFKQKSSIMALFVIGLVFLFSVGIVAAKIYAPIGGLGLIPVYEYDLNNGDSFLTESPGSEAVSSGEVANKLFCAYLSSTTSNTLINPLYRLQKGVDHLSTDDETDKNAFVIGGWTNENSIAGVGAPGTGPKTLVRISSSTNHDIVLGDENGFVLSSDVPSGYTYETIVGWVFPSGDCGGVDVHTFGTTPNSVFDGTRTNLTDCSVSCLDSDGCVCSASCLTQGNIDYNANCGGTNKVGKTGVTTVAVSLYYDGVKKKASLAKFSDNILFYAYDSAPTTPETIEVKFYKNPQGDQIAVTSSVEESSISGLGYSLDSNMGSIYIIKDGSQDSTHQSLYRFYHGANDDHIVGFLSDVNLMNTKGYTKEHLIGWVIPYTTGTNPLDVICINCGGTTFGGTTGGPVGGDGGGVTPTSNSNSNTGFVSGLINGFLGLFGLGNSPTDTNTDNDNQGSAVSVAMSQSDNSNEADNPGTGSIGASGGTTGGASDGGSSPDASVGESCFVKGTKVLLVDNSWKSIEDVKIGDKVKGKNGLINSVEGYIRPIIGTRKTYILNDKIEFTGDHPFLGKDGIWRVANLELFLEIASSPRKQLNPIQMKVGDILLTNKGYEVIKVLEINPDRPESEIVYDLELDGDSTYTANNFIVHNCR